MTNDIWQYTGGSWSGADLVGYRVEAADGHIGKIDEASTEVGANYIVVDTGPWIFGSKVMLPAGVITSIDVEDRRVELGGYYGSGF
jgi:ribosomal 30S subunit maturation factor RimM